MVECAHRRQIVASERRYRDPVGRLRLDSADVLIGYKEYPHTDTMERAAELFAIIADTVEGKVKPVMARHDCRMIAQYRTSVPPISEFVTRMKSLEGRDGILSVSLSRRRTGVGRCPSSPGSPAGRRGT